MPQWNLIPFTVSTSGTVQNIPHGLATDPKFVALAYTNCISPNIDTANLYFARGFVDDADIGSPHFNFHQNGAIIAAVDNLSVQRTRQMMTNNASPVTNGGVLVLFNPATDAVEFRAYVRITTSPGNIEITYSAVPTTPILGFLFVADNGAGSDLADVRGQGNTGRNNYTWTHNAGQIATFGAYIGAMMNFTYNWNDVLESIQWSQGFSDGRDVQHAVGYQSVSGAGNAAHSHSRHPTWFAASANNTSTIFFRRDSAFAANTCITNESNCWGSHYLFHNVIGGSPVGAAAGELIQITPPSTSQITNHVLTQNFRPALFEFISGDKQTDGDASGGLAALYGVCSDQANQQLSINGWNAWNVSPMPAGTRLNDALGIRITDDRGTPLADGQVSITNNGCDIDWTIYDAGAANRIVYGLAHAGTVVSAGTNPVITNVTPGYTADGEPLVTITGTDLGTSGATVRLNSQADGLGIDTAQASIVHSVPDTELTFTCVRGALAIGPVYLFVNQGGLENATGYQIDLKDVLPVGTLSMEDIATRIDLATSATFALDHADVHRVARIGTTPGDLLKMSDLEGK